MFTSFRFLMPLQMLAILPNPIEKQINKQTNSETYICQILNTVQPKPHVSILWLFAQFLKTGFGFILPFFQEFLWRFAGTLYEILDTHISAWTRCVACGQRVFIANRLEIPGKKELELKNFLYQMTMSEGGISLLLIYVEGSSPLCVVPSLAR